MSEWMSGENRIRIFLGFLILVLIVVNSHSLQLSYQSRSLLIGSLEDAVRDPTERLVSLIQPVLGSDLEPGAAASVAKRISELAYEWNLPSLCVLDWNGRLMAGSEGCALTHSRDFDRLDRAGKRDLIEKGWAMTEVSPSYDPLLARVYGYRVIRPPDGSTEAVLRVEVPAPHVALANRNLRSALIYQVSAFALVLLTLLLALNRLLAPHRRLMAEARSVAGRVGSSVKTEDESQFLLSTFQGVVEQLKDKEQQLEAMHRREKERADETEALATDIIRSMTTGLVSLDESAAVVLVNPAAEAIFRLESSSVVGRPFLTIFTGSRELAGWVEAAISRGESTLRRQVEYRHADGELIHLGVSVIPLRAPDGGGRGALCLIADLTEVIQLRERLFLKENLARLGEMAAGIAHELRNGLATILGNARLLETSASGGEAPELVEALVEEGLSLNRVVTEFLEFARPESLRLASVDLTRLVEELSEELRPRAEDAGVQIAWDPQPCRVEADEVLLKQAIQNLVLNGIEAAGSAPKGIVEIQTREINDYAFVRVRDNGPGIPKENLSRIFTPFFTTKTEGTGLGLALVQKIAVAHNGEVDVESSEGATVFRLKLPLRPEPPQHLVAWV